MDLQHLQELQTTFEWRGDAKSFPNCPIRRIPRSRPIGLDLPSDGTLGQIGDNSLLNGLSSPSRLPLNDCGGKKRPLNFHNFVQLFLWTMEINAGLAESGTSRNQGKCRPLAVPQNG
jgi:hypothetical protein